jgi:hypothetical protein
MHRNLVLVHFLYGEIRQAKQAIIYIIYKCTRTRVREGTDSNHQTLNKKQKNNYYFEKSWQKACGNKKDVVSL